MVNAMGFANAPGWDQATATMDAAGRNPHALLQGLEQFEWDVLTLTPGATLTRVRTFQTFQKADELRTSSLPLEQGRVLSVLGLKFTHNLKFANPDHLRQFESRSRLYFKIEDRDQTYFPIETILPWLRIPYAGTRKHTTTHKDDTGTLTGTSETTEELCDIAVPKQGEYYVLNEPLTLPHGGKATIEIIPPDGMKLDSVGNAELLGSGVIENDAAVFWGKLELYGRLVRPS